jgi:hypothetical protein
LSFSLGSPRNQIWISSTYSCFPYLKLEYRMPILF